MIDFSKIKIDQNIIDDIKSIGNSCGVVNCYILSLIYGFKFDINEFRNIGAGLTERKVHDYAKRNGVNYQCKENNGNKSKVSYADFDILCKNGILMTLSGSNTDSKSGSHGSVICHFKGNEYYQLFSNKKDYVLDITKVENLYLTFYSKQDDIRDFVTFK